MKNYIVWSANVSITLLTSALLLSTVNASAQEKTSLECIVEPEMTIELSAAVSGVVKSVTVDRSDPVKRGQVLATLESGVEQAMVALARARADSDDDIQSRRIERDLSRSKLERVLELYKQKSIPGLEKDEVEAEAALASLALKQAINNKKIAEIELVRAKADLALRSVVSPIDGVVVDRYVHPGELVKDNPVLKVAKINPMRVEIIAPSELFGRIRKGERAEVVIEGAMESSHLAQVSMVDAVVDAASGTFGVRLTLPNPDNTVVGGLKCRARFDLVANAQASNITPALHPKVDTRTVKP